MEKPSTYKPMNILKTMVFLKNFMKKHCDIDHLRECLKCKRYKKCFTITKEELLTIIEKQEINRK